MPKKILLADDSITIQKVVELTFSDGDYEVTAVNNGARAIQKLAESRPDLILSDIIMPEKNGYEVCEYVKSHPEYRNIPVVLLTGTFEPFDPDRAEKAGCDAVVTKPFESQSLIHRVEELIAQARSNATPSAGTEETAAAPAVEEPAWMPAQPEPPAPPAVEPFSSGFAAPEQPFAHGGDIFTAPPAPAPAADLPFEQAESPFAGSPSVEEYIGETRAFPKMTFDQLQQMEQAAPPPPPAPEPSPWDEPADFGTPAGAFATPSFEMPHTAPEAAAEQSEEPTAEQAAQPLQAESPFGAPPDAESFSGETRAFPRMSFDDFQQLPPEQPAAEQAAAPPAEPSPWDEQPEPAFPPAAGETRAFPKMSFQDLQQMTPPAEEPAAPAAEPMPWETPETPSFGAETRAFEPMDVPPPSLSETPLWEEPAAPAWSSTADSGTIETPSASSFSTAGAAPFAEPEPAETPFAAEPPVMPSAPEEAPSWSPAPSAPPMAAPEPAALPLSTSHFELTDEQVDRIAQRVIELMSDRVVRNIAWEVIPDLAETVVKERIRQLESEG